MMNKKHNISIGTIFGCQRVIGHLETDDDGYKRVNTECIFCRHTKKFAPADLYRKDRHPSCMECGAGKKLLPKTKIGQVVGDLKVVDEQRNGHSKNLVVVLECQKCGAMDSRLYHVFNRSAGKCKACGRLGKPRLESAADYRSWAAAKRAFRKENPIEKCGICGLTEWRGYKMPMQIDHIIPRAKDGNHELTNLQYTCPNCHAIKTAIEHPTWEVEKA